MPGNERDSSVAAIKGAPIYVAEEVWEQVGQECSDEEIAQMGKSLQEQATELATHIAKIPTVRRADTRDPGEGQQARREWIRRLWRRR